VLQIAYATVDDSKVIARGRVREIPLFHQRHRQAPQRGIPRHADTENSSTYHYQVKFLVAKGSYIAFHHASILDL
jgi:hypothetical protein